MTTVTDHRIALASPLPYPLFLGANILNESAVFLAPFIGKRVLLVSDNQVGALYGGPMRSALQIAQPDLCLHQCLLPPGEETKSLTYFAVVMDALAALEAGRDCTIIALGGGVVGDLCGFAAACWMRGVDYIQVPTTLLAMVDSSIGGKTAINLPHGKNLVGAFHSPKAVLMDVATLNTLVEEQLCAGFAEVIKYGAIRDAAFFHWLDSQRNALLAKDATALIHAIRMSCHHKAAVVADDFHENGQRALLNFGHTFGHAIEGLDGAGALMRSRLNHGQAVAIGMVLAARLSARLGLASFADVQTLCRVLAAFGLPTHPPTPLPADAVLARMRLDKKNRLHRLRLVLWRGIGNAEIVDAVDEAHVMAVLRAAH